MAETTRKMQYVRLGKSGLKVSKIILGCMSYGTSEWHPWVLDEEESFEHIKRAFDLGINTFDTANMYSNGVSEIVLGKAIKKFNIPRDGIVVYFPVKKIMNDFSSLTEDAYVNQRGLSRKHIFDSVKASLERLQLDYIDVLVRAHLHYTTTGHRFDYETPIEETPGFADASAARRRPAGLCQIHWDVVLLGLSVSRDAELAALLLSMHRTDYSPYLHTDYAIANKLTPFVSMQNLYNLLYREEEREMMPTLKHFGVGCIPWSPLARGYLSRPPAKGDDAQTEKTTRQETDRFSSIYKGYPPDIIQRVQELAQKKGVSMSQIALAWVLSKDYVTAPIIGVTDIKKLEDSIAAIHVELTQEEKQYLEEKYTPQQVFGFQ
ncbi:hypothetical protein NMY22_g10102 [Coprinellus aureogranulatus]|nr:hypothetical protein NMY22_g10102 [Coprinellus aureogranulatus]